MELGLKNKVAMITAGATGIGKAITLGLVKEGVKVVICQRNQEVMDSVGNEIQDTTGVKVMTLKLDVTKVEDVQCSVETIEKQFGRIDILVNSASSSPPGNIADVSHEDWDRAMNVKFLGYVRCAKEVIPSMVHQKWGRIISIIGTGGRELFYLHGPGGVNNAAISAMTRYLAAEVAKYNITVNGVSPGLVGPTRRLTALFKLLSSKWNMSPREVEQYFFAQMPLGRWCQPEDVANLVVFLSSNNSGYISGSVLTIDGCWNKGVVF